MSFLIGFYSLLEYLIISTSGMNSTRGRVAQSVTCLVTDAKLTDPGVASSIPARSHTFVEIDHEIISVNCLFKLAQEKSVVR